MIHLIHACRIFPINYKYVCNVISIHPTKIDPRCFRMYMNMDYETMQLKLVAYAINGKYMFDHGCRPS